MATIGIDGADLVVTLEANERRWGLLSNLRLPLGCVSSVEVVDDARGAVRGMRAPGLGGPQRLIGTWRAKQNKQFVCVRRNQPAIKVEVDGQRYRTILIGSDEAESVADKIRTAAQL